ncbi:MAG: M20/M25/M40 family metallo-hydrolase [Candidatus Bipolaricaulota bacterium]|nr:M20/M25/M40 family metallo-hydrolase [Candidatus Bipolaricaulota bacterium]
MTDPVRLAQELVRIPSPAGAEKDLADFLLSTLRRLGEAERGPLGTVIGRLRRGEGPTLVLTGHMDTVPAGEGWSVPPFAGEIREGFLFGRGAVDMKGALAAQICGAVQAAPDLQGTLYFVYVPHEETAEGVALGQALDKLEKPHLVVLGEPTDLRLGIGHRGRAVLRLLVRGKAAHAAMPELGENAIERMVEALGHALRTPLPEDPLLGQGTVAPVFLSADGGGPVVPDRCVALLDRRIVRGETEKSVLADYQGIGAEASIEEAELRFYTGETARVKFFFPAWSMDPEHPWVVRVWEALGNPPLRVWRFSTDGVESCGRRGIPTVGFGPGDEKLAHRPDERVAVEDLRRAAAAYARLLRHLLGPEGKALLQAREKRPRNGRPAK